MAHVYIITRGIKRYVDRYIQELSCKYLPFMWRDEAKGEKELTKMVVELQVRPIQLWEIVYPEEHKDIILSTLFKNTKGQNGTTQHPWHEKYVKWIRRFMGLQSIPEYNKVPVLPVLCENMEVVGVGYKPDYWVDKDGKHINEKEEGAFEGL